MGFHYSYIQIKGPFYILLAFVLNKTSSYAKKLTLRLAQLILGIKIKSHYLKFIIFGQRRPCILAMSTSTSTMMGVCYTDSECRANGGTANGNCASGMTYNTLI